MFAAPFLFFPNTTLLFLLIGRRIKKLVVMNDLVGKTKDFIVVGRDFLPSVCISLILSL